MAKQKFYTVWIGRKTGVFDNWNDCKTQVNGFSGAEFKSFKTRELAEQAFTKGPSPSDLSSDSTCDVSADYYSDDVPWEQCPGASY